MNPVYISCAVISAAPTPKKVVKSNNGRPTKKAKAEDLAVVQVIVLDEVKCAAYVDGKKQKISFFKVLVPNSLSALVQVYEDVQLCGDVGYLPSKWVAFMCCLDPSLHYCVDKQEEFGKLTMDHRAQRTGVCQQCVELGCVQVCGCCTKPTAAEFQWHCHPIIWSRNASIYCSTRFPNCSRSCYISRHKHNC